MFLFEHKTTFNSHGVLLTNAMCVVGCSLLVWLCCGCVPSDSFPHDAMGMQSVIVACPGHTHLLFSQPLIRKQ